MTDNKPEIALAVLCFSGGMDSTSLLYHLLASNHSVMALSFDYGQKHKFELSCVDRQLSYLEKNGFPIAHQRIDLSDFGSGLDSALTNQNREVPLGHYESDSMKETVVPNRNAIFFSIAAAKALSIAESVSKSTRKFPVRLSLAVHSGDHEIYPDCRPEFYEAMWKAFELGNWNADLVEMYLPYLQLDKATILGDAQRSIEKLGLDFNSVFKQTCTSYQPDEAGISHGLTGSDVERILAFHKLGIADPVKYRKPWNEVVAEAVQMETEFKLADQNDL